MSDSDDVSEVSVTNASPHIAEAVAAHFPHEGVVDASDVEEIHISDTAVPVGARETAASNAAGGRRGSRSGGGGGGMSAFTLFPLSMGPSGANANDWGGGDGDGAQDANEPQLSGIVTCHMARRDLQRILARARLERSQDLFDCYFLSHVVVDDPEATITGSESILCRACSCAIAAHGESPIGTADNARLGSLARPPRRPAVLDQCNAITTGFSRPALVLAGFFLATAVATAALGLIPHISPASSPLPLLIAAGVAAALSVVCLAATTRTTVEFDTEARTVRVLRSRALLPCGCDAVWEWSFRDIAGVVAVPDGARADPDARGGGGGGGSSGGRPSARFASYVLSLEVYTHNQVAIVASTTTTTTGNPLTVRPQSGSADDDDDDLDADPKRLDEAAAAAAALPVESIVLERRVAPRDIAQTEADWLFFMNSLLDPI